MLRIFISFLLMIFVLIGCEKHPLETTVEIEEINCKPSYEQIATIKTVANYEFDFYHTIFKEQYPVLKVKLFGDSAGYRQYQKDISNTKSSNGFYSQSKHLTVVYKNAKFMKTIFHELNHYIMHHYVVEIPKWINEGLSEYFEYSTVRDNQVTINPQPKKIERLKQWRSEKDMIDLPDFLSWTNKQWLNVNKEIPKYSYTLSWGLVYYFMEDNLRKEILKEILGELKKGKSSINAVNKHYPGGIKALKIDFLVFVDLKI